MCPVRSWYFNGICLLTGSLTRAFLRSIRTAHEWSSMNLTDKGGLGDIMSLGMDGLRQAPLYFTMKIIPPRSPLFTACNAVMSAKIQNGAC